MNPVEIINEYYVPGSRLHEILVRHGEDVANKAASIITMFILGNRKELEEVLENLAGLGCEKADIFRDWVQLFGVQDQRSR